MDQLLDLNDFPILNSSKTDEKVIKSIRLLSIFGANNSYNVIFATNEDIVYGFGDNSNGCLGLGHWGSDIQIPVKNKVLSHKNLIEIAIGHQHYLGLTGSGQVYAWGQNNFGESGRGEGNVGSPKPVLIRELVGMEVIQVCCGSSFSLALTSYGHVYSWGRNSYHQLGLGSAQAVWLPKRLKINDRIVSISCGRIHAIALTDTGKLYVWGVFTCGQKIIATNSSCNPIQPPSILPGFDDIFIAKAVCGSHFLLFLTSEGHLYSYGNNFDGQVGMGTLTGLNGLNAQAFPLRIGEHIQFKDIITSTANNLSIGVSKDNQYFVWGFAANQKVFSPKRVDDSTAFRSVFEVYTKFARNKVTFKTIVLNPDISSKRNDNSLTKRTDEKNLNEWLNNLKNDLRQQKVFSPKNDIIIEKNFNSDENRIVRTTPENSPPKTVSDNCSESPNNDQPVFNQTSEKVFQDLLVKSFNNPEDHDFRLIFKDKVIYCHKTVLKFRNKEFYQKCKNQLKNGNKKEVRINPFRYNIFFAFIQHIYGQTPKVNQQNCSDLLKMATIFKEQELIDFCQQFLNTPKVTDYSE